VRVTARSEARRASIEAVGAQCWIGTPDRLGTLRGALENVTFACWLLGSADGSEAELRGLHGPRLEAFVRQLIDTTVRGLIYEATGPALPGKLAAEAEQMVRGLAEHNEIPHTIIRADPDDPERWMEEARAAVSRMLNG
jgi:hypothetical protein